MHGAKCFTWMQIDRDQTLNHFAQLIMFFEKWKKYDNSREVVAGRDNCKGRSIVWFSINLVMVILSHANAILSDDRKRRFPPWFAAIEWPGIGWGMRRSTVVVAVIRRWSQSDAVAGTYVAWSSKWGKSKTLHCIFGMEDKKFGLWITELGCFWVVSYLVDRKNL